MKYIFKIILPLIKFILKELLRIFFALIFVIVFCYLTINLIIERLSKIISIITLTIWHFNFKLKWLDRLENFIYITKYIDPLNHILEESKKKYQTENLHQYYQLEFFTNLFLNPEDK